MSKQVIDNEVALESLYWEFDDQRNKKVIDERSLFKGKLRYYAGLVAGNKETPDHHSDDLNVDMFAGVMKQKLSQCREKGRVGWEDCPIEFLNSELIRHISKGDPIDVANFAMMIHQRGEKIKTPEPKRWTVEDHNAGMGPDIDCKATYIPEAFHVKQCTVLFIDELRECAPYYISTDDGWRGFVSLSTLSPIETPEEKAVRLKSEWCAKAAKQLKNLEYASTLTSLYDAMLCGELVAPKGGE